ncbi:hypothetical protein [Pseudomonas syringae]|uniref:hypothetical protein n=1 Tax=Pseudomonas syringae TaxID=317 RepID=UPI003204AB86
MSEAQQVITIDDISADNAPAIYVTGGLNQFLEAVTAEVTAEVPDLTTAKGRARIASLANKVSKSKKAVEDPGRDYLKRLKEMPKVVETELREFVNSMNALRDATRKPLTDWEEANDKRIDGHNDGIQRIKDMAVFAETPTAAHVAQIITNLELVEINDSWEEFLAEAAQAKDRSLATLRTILADRTKHEAELAEIAKFNAEKAEREQKERDAEQRQAEAVERARLAEVQRQEDAKAEELRQQKAREDDKAHKASINRAALEAFIAGGMPEDCARQAVTLIAQRKIPNISIQY